MLLFHFLKAIAITFTFLLPVVFDGKKLLLKWLKDRRGNYIESNTEKTRLERIEKIIHEMKRRDKERKLLLLSQNWKYDNLMESIFVNVQFDSTLITILHFGCTNIIFADCNITF